MKKRRLFVMRHAERMDFAFGNWISTCFDGNGIYRRKDLNQPKSLPIRSQPQEYVKDSPLTTVGLLQASLVGESMKDENVCFEQVFCSPSFRCIQTCANVLKALGLSSLPINVEPGLFEWLGWYQEAMPQWMSLDLLNENGYNVNSNYKPLVTEDEVQISMGETVSGFYERCHSVVMHALNSCTGDVLLVAHAASLDVCTRKLVGKGARNEQEFITLIPKISYCSVAVAEEESEEKWNLVEPPLCSLVQCSNQRYDWKFLA